MCPNHWILLGAVLFSSSGGNANALQTPTQVNKLSLGDKTRMLPEKWRNFRTECSHEQQVLIHELTNCQEFLHSQHVTRNFGSTDLNGPSSTRFIWGLASVTTARFEPTFLFILLFLICTIFFVIIFFSALSLSSFFFW